MTYKRLFLRLMSRAKKRQQTIISKMSWRMKVINRSVNIVVVSRSTAVINSHNSFGKTRVNSSISRRSRHENSRMSSSGSQSPQSNSSLNYERRRKESEKIRDENTTMLMRLRSKRSVYNVNKWQDDESQRQWYLKNISDYPRNNCLGLPTINVMLK